MNPRILDAAEALAELASFESVLDVRSPGEYVLDHVPTALNWPVLDDAQRAHVGTVYKQVGSFEAKRLGAVMVARNIADHIERGCASWQRQRRVLAYCWRGGNRSGAMAHVLAQIGFHVFLVRGGYKALRAELVRQLDVLASELRFTVVCGPTGCGKSRLLQALHQRGAQVLDLENLAAHRGSVLGGMREQEQPPQKLFETRIWDVLRGFDPAREVFVESESRKIGRLHVPAGLIESMRASACLRVEADTDVRAQVLLGDYADMIAAPDELIRRLHTLRALRGAQTVARWADMVQRGDFLPLVHELLQQHYDPSYAESTARNYRGFETARVLHIERADAFGQVAAQLLGEAPPA